MIEEINAFRHVLRIERKRTGKGNQNADIATTLHVIGLSYEKQGFLKVPSGSFTRA